MFRDILSEDFANEKVKQCCIAGPVIGQSHPFTHGVYAALSVGNRRQFPVLNGNKISNSSP